MKLPRNNEFPLAEQRLPTIALVVVPHPTVPHFFQQCFEYVEPWQWSSEAERVETGKWFFARRPQGHKKPQAERTDESA